MNSYLQIFSPTFFRICLCLMLSGCSVQLPLPAFIVGEPDIALPGPTVGQAIDNLAPAPKSNRLFQAPDAEEVLVLYKRVLDQLANPEQNYQVATRIAELEMLKAEAALIDATSAHPYQDAIAGLERLLQLEQLQAEPSADHETVIRYQLAHAYDQSGQPQLSLQHLNKVIALAGRPGLATEARFRRAELSFTAGDFKAAAQDYDLVSQVDGKYQIHALTMLGWANFKQGDLDFAMSAFIAAMGYLLDDLDADPLQASQQELLTDITRISLITLDYLEGEDSLAEAMAAANEPKWQVYLYQALGNWYRQKERFLDSANTLMRFIETNPLHKQAPAVSLQIIDTYREAGFVVELATLKQDFVERYDKESAFFEFHGEGLFITYRQTLLQFLDEQTARIHAFAQESNKAPDYLKAAAVYQRWLLNFSDQPEAVKIQFLLAETFSDGEETHASVKAYQKLLRDYPDSKHHRDAAYAVILGLAKLPTNDVRAQQRIDANLYFIKTFYEDERALFVRINVATMLFDRSRFVEAADIAQVALGLEQVQRDAELLTKVLRIVAHSRYESGDFLAAEVAYTQLLVLDASNASVRESVLERLLASVFRQAEKFDRQGQIETAISLYQRLLEIDKSSELAINAQYDIATLYEQLDEVGLAAQQLQHFRKLHPRHVAVVDIPKRLVSLYERLGLPESAAAELLSIYNDGQFSRETQRQALFRAGQLFLLNDNTPRAIETFRTYAHQYESPFAVRMEAMQHMDELYQTTGERNKRRFWLRKKRDSFYQARANEQDERTRYLAADAAFVMALDQLEVFKSVQLKLPLKASLRKKRQGMKQTLVAFEQASEFGVAQFVTGATFQMGSIYQSLATAILSSDRPKGLNELELSQYEVLLEEQAYPFEEQAINIHMANLQQGWSTGWDDWVDASLDELDQLSPGRFRREEVEVAYAQLLY